MTEDERKTILLQALDDQAWQGLADYLEDIERIADNGPASKCDEDIVCMTLCAVAGRLRKNRYEATEAKS